jgi:fatty-acid desaturase
MIKFCSRIANDTLKKFDENGKRRWSRTSLTMFSAWLTVLFMAIHSYLTKGLDYYVFGLLLTVATGIKIADSVSKNLTK